MPEKGRQMKMQAIAQDEIVFIGLYFVVLVIFKNSS